MVRGIESSCTNHEGTSPSSTSPSSTSLKLATVFANHIGPIATVMKFLPANDRPKVGRVNRHFESIYRDSAIVEVERIRGFLEIHGIIEEYREILDDPELSATEKMGLFKRMASYINLIEEILNNSLSENKINMLIKNSPVIAKIFELQPMNNFEDLCEYLKYHPKIQMALETFLRMRVSNISTEKLPCYNALFPKYRDFPPSIEEFSGDQIKRKVEMIIEDLPVISEEYKAAHEKFLIEEAPPENPSIKNIDKITDISFSLPWIAQFNQRYRSLHEATIDLVASSHKNISTPQLKRFIVRNANTRRLPAGLLVYAPRLEELGLSDNRLVELPEGFLDRFPVLRKAKLTGNYLHLRVKLNNGVTISINPKGRVKRLDTEQLLERRTFVDIKEDLISDNLSLIGKCQLSFIKAISTLRSCIGR